jgi:hypothetical protein
LIVVALLANALYGLLPCSMLVCHCWNPIVMARFMAMQCNMQWAECMTHGR